MNSRNAQIRKEIEGSALIRKALRRSDFIFQVRQKMVDKGIKNSDIAERVGVSEANVSRWLKGNQNITIDTIYLLADAIEEPLLLSVGYAPSAGAMEHEGRSAWEDASSMVLLDVEVNAANVFFMADHPKLKSSCLRNYSGASSYEFVDLGVEDDYTEARA